MVNLLIVLLLLACANPAEKQKQYKTLVRWKSKSGEIKAKGILINGQKQGLWNEFEDSGDLKNQCEYINDTLNGKCLGYYFDSGKLMIDGSYKNGKKDGQWVIYHENGKIDQIGIYKEDMQVGVWKYFYENGTLEEQKVY